MKSSISLGSASRAALTLAAFFAMGVAAAAAQSHQRIEDVVDEAIISTVRLRPEIKLRGSSATLADVLSFADADPRLADEIGDKPIAPELRPPASIELTHDQILRRLEELGVNRARVLLGGAARCRVTLEADPAEPRGAEPAHATHPGTNPGAANALVQPTGDAAPKTLAELIRGRIAAEFAADGGTIEVEFETASNDSLALSAPPFEFNIRNGRSASLGLRDVLVAISRDGRVQRNVRLGVHVKLVKQVLVAAKPLNVGSYVTRDSLQLAARVFDTNDDFGVGAPEQIIGQQVKQFVPVGQMLKTRDIKAVDMVKRSRPVTVEGGERVSIRVTGVALDNGGFGDTIRVRLGDNKANRREIRGVVTGVGTVRLTEEGV